MAKETLKNQNNLEILTNRGSVTTSIINGGTTQEKIRFNLKGRVRKNVPTVIGTLELTPEASKYIPKKPSLISGSNVGLNSLLKLRLKKTITNEKGRVTSYLFDVVYTAKESLKFKKIAYSLKSNTRVDTVIDTTKKIYKVDWGRVTKISPAGESKYIVIHGDPGASFKFSINQYIDSRDSNNKVLSYTEKSILERKYFKAGLVGDALHTQLTIGSSGKYIINQNFPKISNNYNNGYNLNTYPDQNRYSINIRPAYSGFANSGDWDFDPVRNPKPEWSDCYSKTLTQNAETVFVFRATTESARYKINNQTVALVDHDSDGGTHPVQVYDKRIRPRVGNIHVRLDLSVVNTVHAITSKGTTFVQDTHFTNSDFTAIGHPSLGSGTIFQIRNFTIQPSDDTAILSFDLGLTKLGSRNLLTTLNLDTFINCA